MNLMNNSKYNWAAQQSARFVIIGQLCASRKVNTANFSKIQFPVRKNYISLGQNKKKVLFQFSWEVV